VFQFLLAIEEGRAVPEAEVLSAPLVLEYPFRRTVGRVMCPPAEYDPVTGDELDELVTLGETGTVTTWSWEPEPRPGQPLDRPFAWALIRLDGADTGLLHAVDAGSPDRMRTGLPVRIRWADERQGAIGDIACFEPVEGES
jgi:uncharacterized OB-fold protein